MFSRLCSLSLLVVCLTAVAACSEAPARGGRGGSGGAYTGTGTFVLENFYAVAALDDFSGFGIAPTYAGCP